MPRSKDTPPAETHDTTEQQDASTPPEGQDDACGARCCSPDGDKPPGIPQPLWHLREVLADLTPYEGNARRGDLDLIVESLSTNGQYRPIVVNQGTLTERPDEVLAGNHTREAARRIGWVHIAATFVDVDDAGARRIVAVDNRSNDVAGYDDRALLAILDGLGEDHLTGSGFDAESYRELVDKVYAAPPAAPDEFPAFGDDIETEYECPSCSYSWSGRPKPGPQHEDSSGD